MKLLTAPPQFSPPHQNCIVNDGSREGLARSKLIEGCLRVSTPKHRRRCHCRGCHRRRCHHRRYHHGRVAAITVAAITVAAITVAVITVSSLPPPSLSSLSLSCHHRRCITVAAI